MEFKDKIDFLNGIISMLPDCISLSVKRYIACQFALESGFGKSASACRNNNFCGMKVPSTRITLALNFDEKGKFAVFGGIYSCLCDYLLWLQYNRFTRKELSDVQLFEHHLDIAGYCPDLGYFDKIKTLYSQYYG